MSTAIIVCIIIGWFVGIFVGVSLAFFAWVNFIYPRLEKRQRKGKWQPHPGPQADFMNKKIDKNDLLYGGYSGIRQPHEIDNEGE